MAMDLKHPAYDCFYLAMAQRESATLVTADQRLAGVLPAARVTFELIGLSRSAP
jgi:predicted nucleic acid-binding protein